MSQTELGLYSNLTYLPIRIFLPKNKKYTLKFEGQTFHIEILDKKRSLTILDINNEILLNPPRFKNNNWNFPDQLITIKDSLYHDIALYVKDEPGHLMFHTPITTVITEFEGVQNNENCKVARQALEAFIKSYQYISVDTLAFTPTEMVINSFVDYEYFHKYTQDELRLSEIERAGLVFDKSYTMHNVDIKAYNMMQTGLDRKEDEHDIKLELLLASIQKNEFILSTMYKAETQLYPFRNYKYALLDFFFVIESVVFNFIIDKKIKAGLSKTKLKLYKQNATIYKMIKEMPDFIKPVSQETKELLNDINDIRKIRNDIVHNGGFVSKEDAFKAKSAAYNLIKILDIPAFSTEVPQPIAKNFPMIPGMRVILNK